MRHAWLGGLLALVACGAPTPPPVLAQPQVARLSPPPFIDPDVRGAAYLTAVALQLQPAWHSFLEDCRLRLPASHPLNEMSLATQATLEIDRRGAIVAVQFAPSGSADFDRAARHVIADASPLPAPPRELWSDDDHVYLVWLFARDRRQAGPATASIEIRELPLRGVVDRLIGQRDLGRAAQRIARAKPGADRDLATGRLMIAALREALDSTDGAVRRAAVDAIARTQAVELYPLVRQLATDTSDVELRIAVMDRFALSTDALLQQLRVDIQENPRLAAAEVRALVRLEEGAAAAALVRDELARSASPSRIALQVLAHAPSLELAPRLVTWMRAGDARTREGVCGAIGRYPEDIAWPLIAKGLRDRDATVRATCVDAARTQHEGRGNAFGSRAAAGLDDKAVSRARGDATRRIRELAQDRDRSVRARAIRALARLAPASVPDASGDPGAEVRVAFAAALALQPRPDSERLLLQLLDDRDPDVRAAAWTSYIAVSPAPLDKKRLATRAMADSAPAVRLAALPAIEEDELLLELSRRDESSDVRTAALVQLATIRTRFAIGDLLLQRLAQAAPGTAERVRTAQAWLLAR